MVVLHALRPTSRKTTIDFLGSFQRHLTEWDVTYLHFAEPIPENIYDIKPDVLIINYDFLNYRFTPLWVHIRNKYKFLADASSFRIALVQDDYWGNKFLDKWIRDWKINRVLTPLSEGLEFLYKKSHKKVEFKTVLTGYLNANDLTNELKRKRIEDRPIDLGQRVRELPLTLGTYAQEKASQAKKLSKICSENGFSVDVSTDINASLVGNEWEKFLENSKFTVSMKGGASLNDNYGLTQLAVDFSHKNSFKFLQMLRSLVLASKLKRRDRKYVFKAVSPRLFEAALFGTCQILTPDDYLGVLEPWVHYIPLESDFSNVDEVINAMRDTERAQKIANACFQTLIVENDFTDRQLVNSALGGIEFQENLNMNFDAWEKFKLDLQKNQNIFLKYGENVHDLVHSEIYEIWMIHGIQEIHKFKKRLEQNSLDFTDLKINSKVSELLLLFKFQEDILRLLDQILDKKFLKWQIWPWRPMNLMVTD